MKERFHEKIFDIEFMKWSLDPIDNCINCLRLINKHKEDEVMLDLSGGLKPRCFGMNYAAFNKHNVIKISYYDHKTKRLIVLPKLRINLTTNQKKVLKHFEKEKPSSKLPTNHSTFYYQKRELTDMGYIINNKITTAGRIALLITK